MSDCDRLFYVIHERVRLSPKAITPHLWSYRSRITLEHLLQVLQTRKERYPILHEFVIQASCSLFLKVYNNSFNTGATT